MYVEYRVTNLAELLEMAQSIHNEVNAEAGETVDPSTILFGTNEWAHVAFTLIGKTLTDKSRVYDVEAA